MSDGSGALLTAALHPPRATLMATLSLALIFSPSLAKLVFASFGVTITPSGIQPVRGHLRGADVLSRHPAT